MSSTLALEAAALAPGAGVSIAVFGAGAKPLYEETMSANAELQMR